MLLSGFIRVPLWFHCLCGSPRPLRLSIRCQFSVPRSDCRATLAMTCLCFFSVCSVLSVVRKQFPLFLIANREIGVPGQLQPAAGRLRPCVCSRGSRFPVRPPSSVLCPRSPCPVHFAQSLPPHGRGMPVLLMGETPMLLCSGKERCLVFAVIPGQTCNNRPARATNPL
jgi:hypothetical protein